MRLLNSLISNELIFEKCLVRSNTDGSVRLFISLIFLRIDIRFS